MAQEVIFAEQTVTISSDGVSENIPVSFTLTLDKVYTVVWDGVEYMCAAQDVSSLIGANDGAVLLGNGSSLGLAGNNEPFAVSYVSAETAESLGWGTTALAGFSAFSEEDVGDHTVAIYQEVESEGTSIVLKDRNGNDVTYEGIKTVTFDTPTEGEQATFTLGVEQTGKEVEPDFSGGDQVVKADDGHLLKELTIKKPETLVPENVAKDVEIGGVVGTHEGGAGTGAYNVRVIDYDGTVLAEKNLNEGEVFALPDAPAHDRLVFEGWSSPVGLADNTLVMPKYDLVIGAVYHTASGATEIDIELTAVTGLTFNFNNVLTGMTSIDWGDGSSGTSMSHTYASAGEYTIKIYGLTAIANGSTSGGVVAGSSSSPNHTIKAVFLGEGVTSIGSYAFYYCYSLISVVLPEGVTSIGNYAFYYCYSLEQVTISGSVTSIGGYAFQFCCALKQITIPEGVTSIGTYAFTSCFSLEQVTIPGSVTSIGGYAFYFCRSLNQVTILEGVTSIGTYAFSGCYALKQITISGSVTSIGGNAMSDCFSLEQVTIPGSVTSIGGGTFTGCRTLKQVTIPKGVTSIGAKAFYSCYTLLEHDFSAFTSVPTLANTDAFTGINGLCKIKVPSSLLSTWKAATNWSTYASYMVGV